MRKRNKSKVHFRKKLFLKMDNIIFIWSEFTFIEMSYSKLLPSRYSFRFFCYSFLRHCNKTIPTPMPSDFTHLYSDDLFLLFAPSEALLCGFCLLRNGIHQDGVFFSRHTNVSRCAPLMQILTFIRNENKSNRKATPTHDKTDALFIALRRNIAPAS